ncbi:hypothetical protein GKC34_12650, partial [Lactobacillus salivarius]|nr:hypothetical protein [Ligilactobacillus salivarius]
MAVSGYYDKDDYDWREYDDYVGKRFDRWAKSQVFFGNPPLELFQKKIMQLSANDLLKLRLKLESQKRNIESIEKGLLYIGATINAVFFMSCLFIMRDIFTSKNGNNYLELVVYALIGYLILVIIIMS